MSKKEVMLEAREEIDQVFYGYVPINVALSVYIRLMEYDDCKILRDLIDDYYCAVIEGMNFEIRDTLHESIMTIIEEMLLNS